MEGQEPQFYDLKGMQVNRDAIDFHKVLFEHERIHERLVNWSRYVSSGRGRMSCMPMFRLYRAPNTWHNDEPHIPIDSLDGSKMESAVARLPEKHCGAIRWQYVYSTWGVGIHKACRLLVVRPDTLHKLVVDGRAMLKNRAV